MRGRRSFRRTCSAIGGAIALAAASAASAGVITATYNGVIVGGPVISTFAGQGGIDYFGRFSAPGTNLVGTPFSVVYTTDESTAGAAEVFRLNDYSWITGATTAVLSINGHDFSFAEPSFRVTFANSPPYEYNGWGTIDFAGSGDSQFQYGVESKFWSATDAFTPSYLYNVPFSHVAQADDSSVTSLFWMFNTAKQTYVEELPFSITSVDVTVAGDVIQPPPPPPPPGVPEPSTWALALLGFASLGLALRRARRLAAVRGI